MSVKITNATAVYIIMVIVFAAGLWAILSFGTTLRAAPDLSGDWQLTDRNSGEISTASISQSGRFLLFTLKGQPAEDLRMMPGSERTADFSKISLRSKSRYFTLTQTRDSEVYDLAIMDDDTRSGVWLNPRKYVARLTSRTYPRAQPATRAAGHAL